MAILDLYDLDHMTKMGLLVVGCRAGRFDAIAAASIPRVAADLQVHYDTAKRALDRLDAAGILTPSKSPGRTSRWEINPAVYQPRGTPRSVQDNPADLDRGHPADLDRGHRSIGENLRGVLGGDATLTPNGVAPPITVKAARAAARANLNGKH
jgi:hypothetical protein